MKRIMKWFLVLCMILPMNNVLLRAATESNFTFTLTDGRTVTSDDFSDDLVVVIWYSAATDESGEAVDEYSRSMIENLSEDLLIDTEGVTVIAAAVEDMTKSCTPIMRKMFSISMD